MADLAYCDEVLNPRMKVMLAGGYFDLATPFFEGMFEMHHPPMPDKLAGEYQPPLLPERTHGVRERRRC